ncbi:MAG: phosphatase PAP2 family protein [Bacteroides sp.]
MNLKFIFSLVLPGLFLPNILTAQNADSLQHAVSVIHTQKRILNSKVYQIAHIGVPLIAIGAFTCQRDRAFSDMRNSYLPRFRSHYDDYLQYAPGAILLGLKSFGVEGRSSWGRMLASDAFCAGIMAITVNSLKTTVKKERPDRSGNNSFPSGHSATAFMMATMLHHEYGTTRSPLYSILGYSIATTTAVSRQLNNKHWFSDVLTGAGIGIVSTELGYYLADLIFKDKGLVRPVRHWEPAKDEPHSYLGIQMGYSISEREVHLPQNIEIEGMAGATASLTGGWFFLPHWGVAGKFSVSQVSPQIENIKFFENHPGTELLIDHFEARSMSYTSLVAGMEYTASLFPGLYAGGTVMGGVGWTGTYRVDLRYKNEEGTFPLINCETRPIPNLDLNVYLMHVTGRNLGIKLFVNYNTGLGNANYSYYAPEKSSTYPAVTGHNQIHLHNLNLGAEVSALLWK